MSSQQAMLHIIPANPSVLVLCSLLALPGRRRECPPSLQLHGVYHTRHRSLLAQFRHTVFGTAPNPSRLKVPLAFIDACGANERFLSLLFPNLRVSSSVSPLSLPSGYALLSNSLL